MKTTVYSPESLIKDPRRLIAEIWSELLRSRELAVVLFHRDLKAQFRQTILGYAWLFLPVLGTTAAWFFLNSSGAVKVAETGIPYPAFVMVGSFLWAAFVDSINKPVQSLTAARGMLIKLNFPRLAPVMAGIGSTALTSSVRVILIIPIFIYLKVIPDWTVIFFPLAYFALVLLGISLGVLLTPIGLLYKDIAKGISALMQFLIYTAPVVYPMAEDGFLATVNRWNPVTYLLEVSRNLLTAGSLEMLPQALIIFAASLAVLAIGWTVLHLVLPRIIERMGM